MKLVAYLRTSGAVGGDYDPEASLASQEAAIRAWAEKRGDEVVHVRADVGYSGASELQARPGLGSAVLDVAEGDAVGIVVYRLDRLARDIVVQETILREVTRRGGRIFSTMPIEDSYLIDDDADPSRRLVRHMLSAVSDYERELIRLRLQAGRARKRDRGGYAYGAPPYGTSVLDHELVPDDDEQEWLYDMRRMRERGDSFATIAAKLNDAGVRGKRGKRWHGQTVKRALERSEG